MNNNRNNNNNNFPSPQGDYVVLYIENVINTAILLRNRSQRVNPSRDWSPRLTPSCKLYKGPVPATGPLVCGDLYAAKSGSGVGFLRLTAVNRLQRIRHTSLLHFATDFIDTFPCRKLQLLELYSLALTVVFIFWFRSDLFYFDHPSQEFLLETIFLKTRRVGDDNKTLLTCLKRRNPSRGEHRSTNLIVSLLVS